MRQPNVDFEKKYFLFFLNPFQYRTVQSRFGGQTDQILSQFVPRTEPCCPKRNPFDSDLENDVTLVL